MTETGSGVQVEFTYKIRHTLHVYGTKSSLHGFYHIYQAKEIERKVFWAVILVLALGCGIGHTVLSIMRYMDSEIFVHVSDEAEKGVFPEITICGLKPFSESLLSYDPGVADVHFRDKWAYFDNWFTAERRQMANESNSRYKWRLKKLFARFMEVVWVSEDSQDLGMTHNVAILNCSYEGSPCDSGNFNVVRDPESWNCYHFSPNRKIPVGSLGLTLVAFVDGAFFHRMQDEWPPVANASSRDPATSHGNELSMFNSLKAMLQSKQRSLNQIASQMPYQSDGIRLIVHKPNSHPMMSLHQLEFESGTTGLVTISQMMIKRLQTPSFDCTYPPFQEVSYVTDFNSRGSHKYSNYHKLLDDYVVEEKQRMVYRACGCYSHTYPFRAGVSGLCYFAAETERRTPSQALMDRMDCHDGAVKRANLETYRLMKDFAGTAACDSTQLTFSVNVFDWPKQDSIGSVVNNYVMAGLFNRTDHMRGREKYQTFNATSRDTVKLSDGSFISHQEAILRLLFNQNCTTTNSSSSSSAAAAADKPRLSDFWCLRSNERLRRNMLKLNIRHWRRDSRLAQEHPSYLWPEALSELGGICGLWLGMSILTVFELMEIAYQMIKKTTEHVLLGLSNSDRVVRVNLPVGEGAGTSGKTITITDSDIQ